MNCPTDTIWIEHAAGRCEAEQAEALEAHLASCSQCAQRFAELRQLDAMLDAWQAPPMRNDLWAGIHQRVVERDAPQPVVARLGGWGFAWRAAAVIALAVGLGHLTGRVQTSDSSMAPGSDTAAVQSPDDNTATLIAAADVQDQVATELYIDAFDADASMSVAGVLLGDSNDTAPGQETVQ